MSNSRKFLSRYTGLVVVTRMITKVSKQRKYRKVMGEEIPCRIVSCSGPSSQHWQKMRKRSKSNPSQHRWLVENLVPMDVIWEIVDTMPSSKGEGVRVGRLGGLIGSRQLGKGPLRDKRLAPRRGKLIDSHKDRMHHVQEAGKL